MITFNLEFTFQTIDDNVEMQLTHTRNNRLTTLLVRSYGESRILFGKFGKPVVQFRNIGLALRLNGNRDHCVWESHRLQYDRMSLITKRITGTDILETYSGTNITRINALHRDFLVRVHLEQTTDTLFFARTRIVNIRAGSHFTRVNTEEHQATHKRIGSNFECKCCRRFRFRRFTIFLFICIRIHTYNILGIKR